MPARKHQVGFRRRGLPRLFRAEGIELANQPAIVVVERDRVAQLVVGDRLAAQLAEVVPQLGQFVDVVIAADVVAIVLRHVEIADIEVRKHHLPHARQIADHVADRGKQHAVDEIEPAGNAQLDGRARDAADVALVVGIAVDDLKLIAAAEDAERQHIAGVDEFTRDVDRHVADHLAAGHCCLPLARGRERQILEQRVGASDDVGRSRLLQRCVHCAALLAIKASRPSTASCVVINPSR